MQSGIAFHFNYIQYTTHGHSNPSNTQDRLHCSSHDTAAKWVRMLRRFVIQAWIDYECSTSITKFTPVTTISFLLNKICDGGSSKEPFLKAAPLFILIWAYPRQTKTIDGNFKNAAILPSKVAYRWRACALILPLCQLLLGELRFFFFSEFACVTDWKNTSTIHFGRWKVARKQKGKTTFPCSIIKFNWGKIEFVANHLNIKKPKL